MSALYLSIANEADLEIEDDLAKGLCLPRNGSCAARQHARPSLPFAVLELDLEILTC